MLVTILKEVEVYAYEIKTIHNTEDNNLWYVCFSVNYQNNLIKEKFIEVAKECIDSVNLNGIVINPMKETSIYLPKNVLEYIVKFG